MNVTRGGPIKSFPECPGMATQNDSDARIVRQLLGTLATRLIKKKKSAQTNFEAKFLVIEQPRATAARTFSKPISGRVCKDNY